MNSKIYFLYFSFMSLISEGIFYSGYPNEFFKQIDKQEFIYPRIISRKQVKFRFKRSNFEPGENDDSIYVSFKDWIIKTNLNSNLIIPPHFKTQWASSGDDKKFYHHDNMGIDRCFPLEGEIIGVENSRISLTICDNYYYGLLIVNKKYFFLQPSSTNGSHVFYETQIPGSLISMMDKYNVNFRQKSDQKKKKIFKDKAKSNGLNTKGTNQCNGWEITKEGAKYIQLDPKLCPGNYPKKNDSELKSESKRLRRHSKQFNYLRNDSLSYQPYRVFKTCGNYRRRKRVLTVCDSNEQFDLTGDVAVPEYSNNFGVPSTRFFNSDDVDYSSNEKTLYDNESDNRIMRDSDFKKVLGPKVRWIKIVIGVDYDVIEFHGILTQQYIFTIFNIVSTLYKQISTLYEINIVILKILMYPSSQDSAIRGEDEKYPLYGANKWSRELKDKFSMAMWYTHYPLSVHAKTCYNSKMCDQQWSCIVVRDDGWISSIKIAHAIGHLIGLTHDGDLDYNNTCAAEAILEGTIMGKTLPDVIPVPIWSKCSGREFHTYIDNYRCLARPPISHEVAGYLTGIFTLDDQCRIEFGESFVFCLAVTITDPCRELWCSRSASRKRICTTRKTPTLEGTPCGRGKKCLNSVCTDPYRNITENTPSNDLPDQMSSTTSSSWSPSLNWSTPIIPSLPGINETQGMPLPSSPIDWPPPNSSSSWTPSGPSLQPPTNWTMPPAASPPSSNWTLPAPSQIPAQPPSNWTLPAPSQIPAQPPSNWTLPAPSQLPAQPPSNWTLPAPSQISAQPPSNWTLSASSQLPPQSPSNWTSPAPSQLPVQPTESWTQHPPPYPPPSTGNGQPDTLSNWSQSNGQQYGLPNGQQNGFPNGQQNGFPNGQQNGFPNGLPNGFPTGLPNGIPNGLPNGFPTGMPNGFPTGLPNGSPNGLPATSSNWSQSNAQVDASANSPQNGLPNGVSNGMPTSNGVSTLTNVQPSGARPNWPPYYSPPSAQQNWLNQPPSPTRNWPSDSSAYSLRSLDNSRSLTPSSVWYSSKPQTSSASSLNNQSIFNSRNYSPKQLASSNQRSQNNSAPNLLENQFYSSSNHSMLRNLSEDLLTYRSLDNSSVQPYDHLQNNTMNHLLNNTLDASKLRSPSGPFFN